jgi:5-methylcytosine-specific restriction endonuclease McrA
MLENKYTKIYHSIITRANNRSLSDYCESHHIVPKSLGGSNLKENLVNLTAREHFICHLLLTKMYTGKDKDKMVHAAWAMTTLENEHQQRYKINSKIYEILRKQYAELRSKQMIGKPGRKHSDETKKKISEARKGKSNGPMSEESKKRLSESLKGKNLGKIRTPEQKQAQSERQKGRPGVVHTEETKQKLRQINLGKKLGPKSEEAKNRISNALKGIPKKRESVEKQRQKILGRSQTEKERINYLKAMEEGKRTCQYCEKTTTKGNFIRWHGDQCKSKPLNTVLWKN